MRECPAKGVRAVYFYTAGFSESGEPEWADVEQESRIARNIADGAVFKGNVDMDVKESRGK